MEDLISILEQEDSLYEDLLKLSMSKTPVLISGDLEALSAGTRLGALEAVSADTRLKALEDLTATTSSALQSISAANDSVTVGEKDGNKNQSVAVKISTEPDNALKLVEGQGLFAAIYYDGHDSN